MNCLLRKTKDCFLTLFLSQLFKINYFIALLLICLTSAEDITNGAAVAVSIKQELFDNLKVSVLEKFVEKVKVLKFDDIHYMFNATLFQVHLDLTNMKLHNFNLDTKNSYLRFNAEEPYIEMYLANFTMKFTLNFDLRTNPEFIQDKGNGEIYVGQTTLRLGYTVGNSKTGYPTLIATSGKMDCSDLTLEMNGTAGFSKLIDQMGSFLKTFVKEKINDYLVQGLDSIVNPAINGIISSKVPNTFNVNDEIVANFTSFVKPKFTSGGMTLFFKGEIRPNDEPIIPFLQDLHVPSDIKESGRQLQIVISDYLFNSAIYSLFKKHLLEGNTKNLTDIPASYIKYIFPMLKTPDTTPIWFSGKAIEHTFTPYIKIINGTMTALFDFELDMYADKNTPQLLLKVEGTAQILINTVIAKGFYLTVDVMSLRTENITIKENHIDEDSTQKIDERDIKSFFGMGAGFARNFINSYVKDFKIDMKSIIGDKVKLDEVTMYQKDNYIYGDLTPKINID